MRFSLGGKRPNEKDLVPLQLPQQLEDELKSYLRAGNKGAGLRMVRERTGLCLTDAIRLVEQHQDRLT